MRKHIAGGHDEIDTINRLLRKSPWLESGSPLQIPEENILLAEEAWEIDRLWPLLHSSQVVDDLPVKPIGAVIVLRWEGREYLMDGRRRINYWRRQNMSGPHRVLVVHKGK